MSSGAFTFNVALGREVELYNRVDTNDPTNSAFIWVVLTSAGLEDNSVLRDYDTLAAILAASNDEASNAPRKTLTDADLATYTVDDTGDKIVLYFPLVTYTTPATGNNWRKLLVCYDSDTTSGTDSNIIPVTAHDLLVNGAAIVPNGVNNVLVDFSSNGFVVCR